jgi:hypothetical protein
MAAGSPTMNTPVRSLLNNTELQCPVKRSPQLVPTTLLWTSPTCYLQDSYLCHLISVHQSIVHMASEKRVWEIADIVVILCSSTCVHGYTFAGSSSLDG